MSKEKIKELLENIEIQNKDNNSEKEKEIKW